MERRGFKRVRLRLDCRLELRAGVVLVGNTINISRDGSEMESNDLHRNLGARPIPGDLGIFTFSFRKGIHMESLKLSARIIYIQGSTVGLTLITSDLNQQQHDDMIKLIESGTGKIDRD